MSDTLTPRTDQEFERFNPENPKPFYHRMLALSRQLEHESDALRKEIGKARTICEEIENYAMTANQSVLDDNPEARKEIFRHIRDIARKGCANSFESHTWSENEKLRSRIAAAQKENEELKREQLASNAPSTPGAALLLVRSQAKTAPKASDMDEPLDKL